MGFMKAWENWSQRQWDNWGCKLAPMQKKIEAMELPENVKNALQIICDTFPKQASSLMKFVIEMYNRYGAVAVKALLEAMIAKIIFDAKNKK